MIGVLPLPLHSISGAKAIRNYFSALQNISHIVLHLKRLDIKSVFVALQIGIIVLFSGVCLPVSIFEVLLFHITD